MNAVSRVPPIDPDDPATQQKVRETLSRIEGWLADAAAHFTAWLMMRQNAEGTAGSVLELGVYRGKYLALLYGCSAPMARRVVGVDLFAGEDSRHNRAAIAAVKDTMRSAWGDSDRLELIAADTLKLTATRLMDALAAKAAFVSVDGGHEAIHLENDIDLAAQVLAPGGIVAVDDAFNHTTPGAIEGTCRYFEVRNVGRLAPFAQCYNKLFLCAANEHEARLADAKSYVDGHANLPFCAATLQRMRENATIGFAPRFFGWEIVPFL